MWRWEKYKTHFKIMENTCPSKKTVITVLICIEVLFSLSYIFSKQLLDYFPPVIWATIRSGVTAAFLVLLALLTKRPHPKLSVEFFKPLFGLALLGGICAQLAFLVGLRYTSSSNSAILFSLTPIFTLIIVTFSGEEKLRLTRLGGFGIAFLGVLIIRKVEEFRFSNDSFLGDLITLFSCFCYGTYLALSKNFFVKYDRLWVNAWIFSITSVVLSLTAYPTWIHFQWPSLTPNLWMVFWFGIVGATLITYSLLIWAISYAPASQVALFTYMQPILVTLIAWMFLSEQITQRKVLGGLLIFMGVAITSVAPKLASTESALESID
jgi:drug/metabolite transporter (DMT)-like permease